jgi:PAS domain S-box-containing protein
MAEQIHSIVEHEKTVDSALNCDSISDQDVFEALTELALAPSISEGKLFRSLAESLAAQNIGFAIASLHEDEKSLCIKELFAPDGTHLTISGKDHSDDSETTSAIRIVMDLFADLAEGDVILVPSVMDLIADPDGDNGRKFVRAFDSYPIMATRLQRNKPAEEFLLLCGFPLGGDWSSRAKVLAGKLALALDIVALQANLRAAEAKHDCLFESSKTALLLLDGDGIIREVNKTAIHLLNIKREELLGQRISEVIPEWKDRFDWKVHSTKSVPSPGFELEYQSRDGIVRFLHIEQHSIEVENNLNLLLRISDLSERWRLEEMVRRLGKLKDSMAEHLSVGMILQDANGNFAHVNEAAAEMLGYPIEELLGEHWTMIVPEDQHFKIRQANMRRMCGEGDRYEIQILHKSGKRMDILISESPYHENGRYAGTFIFITDLTALRRAEAKVLQQNRELQRVLERLTALNQATTNSLQTVDAQMMMQQVGEELKQLGMMCLIATLEPEELEWVVRYVTVPLKMMTPSQHVMDVGERVRLPVDLEDPWVTLLRSGETLFVEEPKRAIEGLVSQSSAFELTIDGYETCPRILAPLSTGDRLFGVLIVCGENLTSDDLPAITAFSNHLSIALEKARLLTNTMTQAKLGKVLADIAAAAGHEADISRLLQVTGELILNALNFPLCTFSITNGDKETVNVLLTITHPDKEINHPIPSPGSSIKLAEFPEAQEAMSSGCLVQVKDSSSLLMGVPVEEDTVGLLPAVLIPMTASGETFGLAAFYLNDKDRKLSEDETIFLQTGVEQISVALEKVRLAAEAELKVQIDQALSVLIEHTLASRDMDEVVEAALNGVVNLLPCHFVCLTSFDFEAKTVQVLGVSGGDKSILQEGQTIPLEDWEGISELAEGKNVYYKSADEISLPSSIVKSMFEQGSKLWLSIPLQVQGEIVGALSIGSRQAQIFTPEHMVLARRFTDHLAVALTNARNYMNARRRANELAALYDLALEISGELELQPLLKTSLNRATQLLDATMGAAFLVDEATEEIKLLTEIGLPAPPSVLRLRQGQGLAGLVWERSEPVILEKARDVGDPRWLEACYAKGSAIGVPLFWDGEVRAVLAVFTPDKEQHFRKDEERLLERMAAQVSLGIENVQKHEQINRRVNQLRVVNDLARRISTILIQDLLFTEIVRRVSHGLNIELVVLYLVEGDELVEAASYYLPKDMHGTWEPTRLKIGRDGICGFAAEKGEPFLSANVSQDPNCLSIFPIESTIQSVVSVPLKLKGIVTGVLFAGSERLAAFDQADLDALQALGAHISTCIENARLYEETKEVQYRLAESEKLRSLGLMTSGIAHDFNNLLSVILARTELALNHIGNEQVRRHLEQVIASAKDGGETIHRLQDFARTRKDTSDFIGVDINQVVLEAIEISRPRWKDQAQGEGIQINVTTDLQADGLILGAPAELREVLVNLVFNALEAMPEGGILHISTSISEGGLNLEVTDDGLGMTEEVKRQIFVPFFTTKPGGTGLGLSMVYGVIQRHGGSIDVEGHPGEGTTVKVWLPTSANIDVDQSVDGIIVDPHAVEPATILVVEDEETIRDGLVETFTNAGHHVITAADGLEGFERFLEIGKLDVVFTDLGMPKLSGWELVEQLRAFDPTLPIVILSGWGDEIDPMKVQHFGIAKVIGKPFETARLHTVLHEVMVAKKALDRR